MAKMVRRQDEVVDPVEADRAFGPLAIVPWTVRNPVGPLGGFDIAGTGSKQESSVKIGVEQKTAGGIQVSDENDVRGGGVPAEPVGHLPGGENFSRVFPE